MRNHDILSLVVAEERLWKRFPAFVDESAMPAGASAAAGEYRDPIATLRQAGINQEKLRPMWREWLPSATIVPAVERVIKQRWQPIAQLDNLRSFPQKRGRRGDRL